MSVPDSKMLAKEFEALAQREVDSWRWPERLCLAGKHVFLGGGKRIRPVLALCCADLFGDRRAAQCWAIAVELVHTYSLVHDDLPAMDDDDERRGRPTCHVAFDEGTAILVGDALLTRAFEVISEAPLEAELRLTLVNLLSVAAGGGGMVGGQIDDLFGDLGSLDALVSMQTKKTGALLIAAAVGGALCAGAPATSVAHIENFSHSLGLLFQLTDDMIDKVQDEERISNNFHHHMDESQVIEWRDRLVGESLKALDALDENTQGLADLITLIGTRKV